MGMFSALTRDHQTCYCSVHIFLCCLLCCCSGSPTPPGLQRVLSIGLANSQISLHGALCKSNDEVRIDVYYVICHTKRVLSWNFDFLEDSILFAWQVTYVVQTVINSHWNMHQLTRMYGAYMSDQCTYTYTYLHSHVAPLLEWALFKLHGAWGWKQKTTISRRQGESETSRMCHIQLLNATRSCWQHFCKGSSSPTMNLNVAHVSDTYTYQLSSIHYCQLYSACMHTHI